MESRFITFKFDYSKTKHLPREAAVPRRNFISAAGHAWEIVCLRGGGGHHWEIVSLPGDRPVSKGKPKPAVKAILFKALVIGADGAPAASLSGGNRWSEHRVTYQPTGDGDDGPPTIRCLGGWFDFEFFSRRELESDGYLIDGCFTFMCGITVLHDDDGRGTAVPCSYSYNDDDDGSDVSFSVGGETFRAHRAVLAASSPVFRALLFCSMAEAAMDSATLHDIQPAAFRVLLRFVYTDALPADTELERSSSPSSAAELLRHLVAVADMYDVDGLKLACAQKLCDHVSPETVGAVLACAESHDCPELKKRCIDFYVDNFRDLVLNDEYLRLLQRFPSIVHEIKAKCHKKRKPNTQCYGPEWDNS